MALNPGIDDRIPNPANFGGAPQSSTPGTTIPGLSTTATKNSGTQVATTTPGLIDGVTNATYQGVDGVYRTVQANETVNNQLSGIIAEDSPLLRQARSKAMEGMASRGLINSSMAASAGQSALYDKALQIATPDAATYAQAARDNQLVGNETQRFNADAANKNSQFNAGAMNEMGLRKEADRANMERVNVQEAGQTQRTQMTNDTSIKTTGMNNDTSIRTTGMNNATTLESTRMNNDTSIRTTQMNNDTSRYGYDQQAATQIRTTEMNNATQMAGYNIQAESQRYTANMSAETQRSIANNANKVSYDLEASRQQHQANLAVSAAANYAYQSSAARIGAALTNPDIPPDMLNRVIDFEMGLANSGMDIAGSAARIK